MNNSLAGKSITDKLEKNFKVKNEKLKKIEEELKSKEKKLVSQKNIIIDLGYLQSIKILYFGQLSERLYSILLSIIYTKVIYISLKY